MPAPALPHRYQVWRRPQLAPGPWQKLGPPVASLVEAFRLCMDFQATSFAGPQQILTLPTGQSPPPRT